jgi:hypothetical protein
MAGIEKFLSISNSMSAVVSNYNTHISRHHETPGRHIGMGKPGLMPLGQTLGGLTGHAQEHVLWQGWNTLRPMEYILHNEQFS